eukprot:TRINITY_DN15326_c0_g1_i1.p1 TRINITY_DN15326_c0_g1~~TRINITY_DN15326_c0_g1_i1.p1  ORF type:complete len:276 (-),score=55.68 TRINITY_DN15326_c0_g1_i1:247-1074(-)
MFNNKYINKNCFKNNKALKFGFLTFGALLGVSAISGRNASSNMKPSIHPEGDKKGMKTKLLEVGTMLMQSKEPLSGINTYMVSLHPMQNNSFQQMQAHHFCKQVNGDFAQCIMFDGNTKDANMIGVEYIISEKLYNELPMEEKHYWNPQNYEILSGQLVLPGVPSLAEKMIMKQKMNTYAKTFQTWRSNGWDGDTPFVDTLPKGDATLAWSFNHDGEVRKGLLEDRDKIMKLNTEKIRNNRSSLVKSAHPQNGVDYLSRTFSESIKKSGGSSGQG